MSALSLLLRLLSICAAVVVVVFYVLGGNKLKDLQANLDEQVSINQTQKADLEKKETQYQKIRQQLDATVLELAGFKRDKRLNESEVLLVKQELEKSRQLLSSIEDAKQALIDENESLRRETIDLKAQGFDASNNPRMLTAQIEEYRSRIRELENELNDSQTVIRSLFASQTHNPAPTHPVMPRSTHIERVMPEHHILVLAVGSSQGIRVNSELHLLNLGNPVAKVKVARVTADLCVVNILSSIDSEEKVLQPGAQIEYMTLSS